MILLYLSFVCLQRVKPSFGEFGIAGWAYSVKQAGGKPQSHSFPDQQETYEFWESERTSKQVLILC